MVLNEAELQALVDDMQSNWREIGAPRPLHQPAARRGKKFAGHDAARIASVWGLARHVYSTAAAVSTLIRANQITAAIPLARLAYESAITAAWLVQSAEDHGVRAFLHEYTRTRSSLQKDALQAASAVFREGAGTIADADPTAHAGSFDSARRFGDICQDLSPAGPDAFIIYRLFSGFSHASPRLADLYFHALSPAAELPAYREEPDVPLPADLLLFFTAASMLWSARAFSFLTQDKAHRSYLRSCARLLEITDELHLSDSYRQRHAKARRS
ncbi:DUF6988 family protein [Microbacterium sp. JZ37]|uniref:DUF6988 family protein n=1 Tax=Microbacterium sp. JZ37 TaxID=2654193 RepID=UPI002B47530F|nr:DUF5677 domain-containing protein [Microbacterium sp. JZ37]WRH18374.1 hypothetical protein GC092_13175 [Microbacterium sp. JZ37]